MNAGWDMPAWTCEGEGLSVYPQPAGGALKGMKPVITLMKKTTTEISPVSSITAPDRTTASSAEG